MSPEELIKNYGIRCFYHFTDKVNVESIKRNGGLLSLDAMDRKGIKSLKPGGNKWSHDADRSKGLHRYIHLAFVENHPMKYVAEQEGRIGPTVVLQVNPAILALPGTFITSDVSNKSGIQRYPANEAAKYIDFDVLYTWTDWKDSEIMERRRKVERSEILVPDFISLENIKLAWEKL